MIYVVTIASEDLQDGNPPNTVVKRIDAETQRKAIAEAVFCDDLSDRAIEQYNTEWPDAMRAVDNVVYVWDDVEAGLITEDQWSDSHFEWTVHVREAKNPIEIAKKIRHADEKTLLKIAELLDNQNFNI